MEWIEGETLAAWSKQKGPATEAECLAILRQVAEGLQHAHELGVVHRDIKPHNLMRGAEGAIFILDFGLARIATEDDANDMTQSRATLGTPAYMAPEQMRDPRRADIRSDLFSVGVTILHLLVAKTPSHDELSPAVVAQRLPNLSPNLRGILNRLLMVDAAARFQSPQELLDALQPAPTIRPAQPKGSLFVALAIGGTLLATLVFLLAAGYFASLGVLFPGASDSHATKELSNQGKGAKTPNDKKVAEEKPGKELPDQGTGVKTPNDKKVAEKKPEKAAPPSPKNAVLKSFKRYVGHEGKTIESLGFGPGEREFCAASFFTLARWNVDDPDKVGKVALPRGALGFCEAVAVIPAKDRAMVGIRGAIFSVDLNAKFQINPDEVEPLISGGGGKVNCLWVSPKGDRFVYAKLTNVGAVQEWPSGKQKTSFKGKACVFCKDGRELVVAVDGRVVWKAVDTDDEFFKTDATKHPATAIAASDDGAIVVTGNRDSGKNPALVYRRGNPTPTPLLGTQGAIPAVAITPDGAYIVTGGSDGALILWDGATLKKLHEIADAHDKKYSPGVSTIRFSADGSLLLSGGGDGVIRSWALVPK